LGDDVNFRFTQGQWIVLLSLCAMTLVSVFALGLLLATSARPKAEGGIVGPHPASDLGSGALSALPSTVNAATLPPAWTETPTPRPTHTMTSTATPSPTGTPMPSVDATTQPAYDPCGVTVILNSNVSNGVKFETEGQVAANFEPYMYRFTRICTGFHTITYYYPFSNSFRIFVPEGYVEVEYAVYLEFQGGCFNCP